LEDGGLGRPINRRAALKAGVFVAGTAWIAPVLEPLRLDAAAAQTPSGVRGPNTESASYSGHPARDEPGVEGDAPWAKPEDRADVPWDEPAVGGGPPATDGGAAAVRREDRLAVLDQTTSRSPGPTTGATPRAQAVSAEIKLTG